MSDGTTNLLELLLPNGNGDANGNGGANGNGNGPNGGTNNGTNGGTEGRINGGTNNGNAIGNGGGAGNLDMDEIARRAAALLGINNNGATQRQIAFGGANVNVPTPNRSNVGSFGFHVHGNLNVNSAGLPRVSGGQRDHVVSSGSSYLLRYNAELGDLALARANQNYNVQRLDRYHQTRGVLHGNMNITANRDFNIGNIMSTHGADNMQAQQSSPDLDLAALLRGAQNNHDTVNGNTGGSGGGNVGGGNDGGSGGGGGGVSGANTIAAIAATAALLCNQRSNNTLASVGEGTIGGGAGTTGGGGGTIGNIGGGAGTTGGGGGTVGTIGGGAGTTGGGGGTGSNPDGGTTGGGTNPNGAPEPRDGDASGPNKRRRTGDHHIGDPVDRLRGGGPDSTDGSDGSRSSAGASGGVRTFLAGRNRAVGLRLSPNGYPLDGSGRSGSHDRFRPPTMYTDRGRVQGRNIPGQNAVPLRTVFGLRKSDNQVPVEFDGLGFQKTVDDGAFIGIVFFDYTHHDHLTKKFACPTIRSPVKVAGAISHVDFLLNSPQDGVRPLFDRLTSARPLNAKRAAYMSQCNSICNLSLSITSWHIGFSAGALPSLKWTRSRKSINAQDRQLYDINISAARVAANSLCAFCNPSPTTNQFTADRVMSYSIYDKLDEINNLIKEHGIVSVAMLTDEDMPEEEMGKIERALPFPLFLVLDSLLPHGYIRHKLNATKMYLTHSDYQLLGISGSVHQHTYEANANNMLLFG